MRALLLSVMIFSLALGACEESPESGGADGPTDAGASEGGARSEGGAASTSDGASGGDVGAPDFCAGVTCGDAEFCAPHTGRCVSDVAQVAAGTAHTCAVHRDGQVTCWGQGSFIGPALPVVTAPRAIALPARATAVAVGIQAACALLADGAVHCWGDLGEGAAAPAPVVTEGGPALGAVTGIAGGSVAFCAQSPAGIHCWGDNGSGELGRPTSMRFPPLTAVLAHPKARPILAATVAILVHDGASQLCGWGNNNSGLAPGPLGLLEQPSCADDVPGVLQLTAGDGHACAHRGGRAFSCWGTNAGGQLGTGDENAEEVALPGTMQMLPAEITRLAAGAYHTCALLETGPVMCWGSNGQGECGVSRSAPIFSPVAVPGLRTGVMGLGSGAGAQHTCAIRSDGSLVCWGNDDQGQLGSGATTQGAGRYADTPVVVRF